MQASVYWVQVSKKGWREPITYNEPSSPKTYRDLTTGTYSVRVSIAGKNPLWSEPRTATITVATPPTPTRIAPRTRTCRWEGGYYLTDYIHRDYEAWVEVTNPAAPFQLWHDDAISWGVWFKFWNERKERFDEEGPGFVLTVVEDGRWTLNVHDHDGEPVYTVDHGDLSTAGVEFAEDWNDTNRIEVFADGGTYYDEWYSVEFTVNGVDVPVTIDADDRSAIDGIYGDRDFGMAMEGKVGLLASGNALFESDPRPLAPWAIRFVCRDEG